MDLLRRYRDRLIHRRPERKLVRAQLKAAKRQSHEAYLSVVANYLDLTTTYFGGTRAETASDRLARAEQVFLGLWQHLRYVERASDFEYMLADALIENTEALGAVTSQEPLVTKLRLLSPSSRFLLLASEFERWPARYIGLALRIRPAELHRLLSEARCQLCGINWDSLAQEERDCLAEISASFEQSHNLRANKALCERTKEFPRVMQIKAQWLELRPRLVEVRHRYLPSPEEREELLANILRETNLRSMHRPRLVDRMVNTVHFSRHEKIQVS